MNVSKYLNSIHITKTFELFQYSIQLISIINYLERKKQQYNKYQTFILK